MVRAEFEKQWKRPRTWATLAALVALSAVLTIALAASGASTTQRVGDVPLLIRPNSSGFSIPVIALSSTMKFFLPLAVALFAGESIAGEASWGSLRYALARPVSRLRILGAKLAVASTLSLVAIVVVPLGGLVIGTLAFGWHPFVAIDGSASSVSHSVVATFSTGAAIGRLALSTAYVAAGMTSIFAFAFFVSTLTTRPFVPVACGVGLAIISRVLNSDYLPGVAVLNPYMPNNDVDLWQHLFQNRVDTAGMVHFLVLQVVYVAVFLTGAVVWFSRKDHLS